MGVRITATSPGPILTGSFSSGSTHNFPFTPATSVSGESARSLNDQGELMTARSAKAPRARGASSNPPNLSMGANYRRMRMYLSLPRMAPFGALSYVIHNDSNSLGRTEFNR
jgi:hypothetical protein